MTQQPIGTVPDWDVADRMRKALRACGVSVQEIAEYLDVSRNAVSTWINGRIEPSTQTLRLWALRTGVPYEWLRTGVAPDQGGDGPDDGNGVTGEYRYSVAQIMQNHLRETDFRSTLVLPLREAS